MDDTQLLEQLLLRQAQQTDDPQAAYDAFEQLHALLEPKVRRFVTRLIGGGEVDDVVQLSFIALYRNLHRIEPAETLRAYLFQIARNRCYDQLRAQGRFEDTALEEETEYRVRVSFVPQTPPEPEDAAHWLLLHLEVRRAMEQLPELQRQTLIFYSEENLSYEEIALVMECSIGTVKSRLFHARKGLRRLLNPGVLRALDEAFVDQEPSGAPPQDQVTTFSKERSDDGRINDQGADAAARRAQVAGQGDRTQPDDGHIRGNGRHGHAAVRHTAPAHRPTAARGLLRDGGAQAGQ